MLIFCLLAGMLWVTKANFILGIGALKILCKEGNNCIEILHILVWMHSYFDNCSGLSHWMLFNKESRF